jgi:hypothetical protein
MLVKDDAPSAGVVWTPSRTIQNFKLRCAMLVKDIASKYTEWEGSGVQGKT